MKHTGSSAAAAFIEGKQRKKWLSETSSGLYFRSGGQKTQSGKCVGKKANCV